MQDILGDVDGIAFVRFSHEDVVRHKLVQRIVEAYKQHAEETGTQRRRVTVVGRGREPQRPVDRRGRRGALARRVLAARASRTASSGSRFVGPEEMRALKREHLGVDEATDVLSFPIDGRDELPEGVPRQLGDVVLCPQVVGRGVARAARPRAPAPARLRPRRRDGAREESLA